NKSPVPVPPGPGSTAIGARPPEFTRIRLMSASAAALARGSLVQVTGLVTAVAGVHARLASARRRINSSFRMRGIGVVAELHTLSLYETGTPSWTLVPPASGVALAVARASRGTPSAFFCAPV